MGRNRYLNKFKYFYCKNKLEYSSCDGCKEVNGSCCYADIFRKEKEPVFDPCPFCNQKELNLCNKCRAFENTEKEMQRLDEEYAKTDTDLPIWVRGFAEAILRQADYSRITLKDFSYEAVYECYPRLTDKQKLAIELYFSSDITYVLLGKMMGISAQTANQHIKYSIYRMIHWFRRSFNE